MSVTDLQEWLIENETITATGYVGTALPITDVDEGVAIKYGQPYEAELRVVGDVTGTSPTLAVVIRATDSSGNVEDIATFGQIGGTTQPVAGIELAAASIKRVVCLQRKQTLAAVPLQFVNIRAYATIGGSATPTFPNVNISLRPLINDISRS
jgi:hypothetical protein